jgi:hypothetical protein
MAANLVLGGSSMAAQTSGHQQRSSGRKGTRCLGKLVKCLARPETTEHGSRWRPVRKETVAWGS